MRSFHNKAFQSTVYVLGLVTVALMFLSITVTIQLQDRISEGKENLEELGTIRESMEELNDEFMESFLNIVVTGEELKGKVTYNVITELQANITMLEVLGRSLRIIEKYYDEIITPYKENRLDKGLFAFIFDNAIIIELYPFENPTPSIEGTSLLESSRVFFRDPRKNPV